MQLLTKKGLATNSTIELLDLRSNHLSVMCAPHLATLLTNNSSLKVLSLAANKIGDAGAAQIAHALPQNTCLNELDIRNCSMGDPGMSAIAKALVAHPSIGKVYVWGNGFGPNAAASWRDLAVHIQEQGKPFFMDIEPYEVDGEPMIALSNEDPMYEMPQGGWVGEAMEQRVASFDNTTASAELAARDVALF